MDFDAYLVYDETSPSCLRWRVDRLSGRYRNQVHVRAGDIAGTQSGSNPYWQVKLNGVLLLCHRVIYEMHHGSIGEDYFVDHFDRDKQNNKIGNLRRVFRTGNARNSSKRSDNSSGVTGVHLNVSTNRSGSISCSWRATWNSLAGKINGKAFSCNKYGDDVAFQLACDYRKNMIEELNKQGAGYTSTHGLL